MEKEKKLLEVGDKIYSVGRFGIDNVYTVERVTTTQAISGNARFKREIGRFDIEMIGPRDKWSITTYLLETEELKSRRIRQNNLRKISVFNFKTLSDQDLEKIISIINQP